jgi:hypothetical protein
MFVPKYAYQVLSNQRKLVETKNFQLKISLEINRDYALHKDDLKIAVDITCPVWLSFGR